MTTRRMLFLLLLGCSRGTPTIEEPLVQGLRLTEIATYQTLKSTLMKDSTPVDAPEVPIIQGRALLLRAFVAPDEGWDGREVIVRFELTANGAPLQPVDVRKTFAFASNEADLDSTANLQLEADQVAADLSFAVSLHETHPGVPVANDAAQYPAEGWGQAPANVRDTGSGEHIVIIPIKYNGDGSGRVPDTSERMINAFRDRMMALYPVNAVEITVGRTLTWSSAVQASGRGWGSLLNAIINQRLSDRVPKNVYYYGLFAPTDSFESFCGGGCVLGLSPASPDPNDEYQRGSIGVGYLDSWAESDVTFVHEVGHAHGRNHAPCGGADGVDRNFPYSNGGIGDWGWDALRMELLDPAAKSRDMMGYCSPVWVSDYTYRGLFDRISYLNSKAGARSLPVAHRWRSIVVEDGQAVRSSVVTVAAAGEARSVVRVDTGDTIPARFYPFDHIPGGILLVPEEADVGTLKFQGLTIR